MRTHSILILYPLRACYKNILVTKVLVEYNETFNNSVVICVLCDVKSVLLRIISKH